jgi:ribosomal protein S18 acetylase RimI-like enzyme
MALIEELKEQDYEAFYLLFSNWDPINKRDNATIKMTLEIQNNYGSKVFVAKENNNLIGYIQLMPDLHIGKEPYLEIVQILVAENYRSAGIGKELFEKSKEYARELGLSILKLNTRVQRSRAHVFYERLGFELEKVSKFYMMKLENTKEESA